MIRQRVAVSRSLRTKHLAILPKGVKSHGMRNKGMRHDKETGKKTSGKKR